MQREMFMQKIKKFGEDTKWLDRHYDELKIEYPDEWVAVFKKNVVGHDRDLHELMEELEKKYGDDAGHMAVEFVSPKKVELTL